MEVRRISLKLLLAGVLEIELALQTHVLNDLRVSISESLRLEVFRSDSAYSVVRIGPVVIMGRGQGLQRLPGGLKVLHLLV